MREWFLNDWPPSLWDVVTLIGFGITIWQLLRTRRAAVAARESAEAATEALTKLDTIDVLAQAIIYIDRIYDLQVQRRWDYVPYLYRDVRNLLDKARADTSTISEAQKTQIVEMNTDFSTAENSLHERLYNRIEIDDLASLTNMINNHRATLKGFQTDLQRQV